MVVENPPGSLSVWALECIKKNISRLEEQMKKCENITEKKEIENLIYGEEEHFIDSFNQYYSTTYGFVEPKPFSKTVNDVVGKGYTFTLNKDNNSEVISNTHIKYFLYKWCFENNLYNTIFFESIIKTMYKFLKLKDFSSDSPFFTEEWKIYPNSDYEDRKEELEKLSNKGSAYENSSLYQNLEKFVLRKDYKNIRLLLQSDTIMGYESIRRALLEETFDIEFSEKDVKLMEQILTTVEYNPFEINEAFVLKLKDKEYLMKSKDEYNLEYLSLMYPIIKSKALEEDMFKPYSKALIVGKRNQENIQK